jgi:hypothetical protein
MWMGLKGVASNWHCLKENDVDCPGECTEMDAKQCTAFELCFSSAKQLVGFFRKYSDNINISDCCLFRSCYYSCYANAINNQYKELYPRMMIDSTGKTRAAKGFEGFLLTITILCKTTKFYKNMMQAGLPHYFTTSSLATIQAFRMIGATINLVFRPCHGLLSAIWQ